MAGALDGLGDDERIAAVAGLGRRQLAALFEAAADNTPLTLADLVPPEVAPMREVIHEGKNSLGVFTRFQKRLCRPRHPAPSCGATTSRTCGRSPAPATSSPTTLAGAS